MLLRRKDFIFSNKKKKSDISKIKHLISLKIQTLTWSIRFSTLKNEAKQNFLEYVKFFWPLLITLAVVWAPNSFTLPKSRIKAEQWQLLFIIFIKQPHSSIKPQDPNLWLILKFQLLHPCMKMLPLENCTDFSLEKNKRWKLISAQLGLVEKFDSVHTTFPACFSDGVSIEIPWEVNLKM